MQSAKVVIGANFGDEGKGLMTDYFASKGDALVIRFNGGGQASHTVTTKDVRHVFHHFGSGTLAGAPTYLSRFFMVNPILFVREYMELKKLGIKPLVFVDRKCLVTTPFDMMLNEQIETFRGNERHGSCGVGLNETLVRNRQYPLYVEDLLTNDVPKVLRKIEKYVPTRLEEMGVIPYSLGINSDDLISSYMEDVNFFLSHILVQNPDFSNTSNIIFEASQGLCLDENHRFFPHVTHSKTGLHNAAILAMQYGITALDVVYVTRWYATRHGAGPFPTEIEGRPSDLVFDMTNVTGKFQGPLRFGWLDLDLLKESVEKDLQTEADIDSVQLAITCLDQVVNPIIYKKDDHYHEEGMETFFAAVFKSANVKHGYLSFGPTRDDIERRSHDLLSTKTYVDYHRSTFIH